MSLVQSLITLILFIAFVFFQQGQPTLSDNERQILIEKYRAEFEDHKYIIYQHSRRKSQSNQIEKIIDKVIENIELNVNINNAKDIVISISQKLVDADKDNPNCNPDIVANFYKFKSNQLSFIENLEFTEQVILCAYWNNWSCNYGLITPEVYIPLDTMHLLVNKNYKLPIRVEYDRSNFAYSIMTNTMQKGDPNFINFSLPATSKHSITYEYQIVARNNITGEFMNFRDSIVVFPIKATTENRQL